MKRHCLNLFLALAMTAALLTGCGSEAQDTAAGDTAPTSSGTDTITFETVDMDGNTVTEEVFTQSKLTMVNVWATYCNPCLSEMPGLGELAGEYDPADFHIIGIVSDVMEGADQSSLDEAADLIRDTGADYTHLLLNESLYYALLTDVSAVPTTFFVDDSGTVLRSVLGAKEKADWEELINELLAEQ